MVSIIEFTSLLQRAVKTVQLYGSESHPRTREAIEHLVAHTSQLLASTPRLQIVVSQNRIFVDGQLLRQQNPSLKWFVDQLTERRLNGFVMGHGITPTEIEQVVRILTLKPQSLADSGGAAALLARIDASHVRLSYVRYEEVREGEIVVPEDSLIGDGSGAGGALEGGSGIGSGLSGGASAGAGSGPGSAASKQPSLAEMAGFGTGMGDGGGFPDLPEGGLDEGEAIEQLSQLTKAWLGKLGSESGTGTDAGSKGAGEGAGAGGPGLGKGDSIPRAIKFQTFAANVASWMREQSVDLIRLRTRLTEMGVSKDELEELLHAIAWEKLGADERLAKALEQNLIFELPREKILAFILELLRDGRNADAVHLIEKLGSGLFHESHDIRRIAVDAFVQIATWETDPGLPPEIEALVDKFLLTHFVRENDPQLHDRSLLAFEHLYDSWIDRDQIPKAYQVLRKLEGAAAAAATRDPWKAEVFTVLVGRLTAEERMKVLFGKMYARDVESSAALYHPLLALFGDKAAERLLEALADEEDRGRRGRLMKAVKAVGKPALQSLHQAMRSQTWYLVRNALNLIGDLVAVDLLDDAVEALGHRDDRVRRAAARALGKLGGLRAEKQLGDALASNDPETQFEILGALGMMRGDSAIPQIVELTRKRIGRGDEAVRIKALEALGQIGSAAAVPALVELLRKKGLLGGESNDVRLAAAKALATLAGSGAPEARTAVDAIAAAEADGPVRQALRKSATTRA